MVPGVSQLSTLVCNAAAMGDPKGSSRSFARRGSTGTVSDRVLSVTAQWTSTNWLRRVTSVWNQPI